MVKDKNRASSYDLTAPKKGLKLKLSKEQKARIKAMLNHGRNDVEKHMRKPPNEYPRNYSPTYKSSFMLTNVQKEHMVDQMILDEALESSDSEVDQNQVNQTLDVTNTDTLDKAVVDHN